MRELHNTLFLGPEFLEFSDVQEHHIANKSKILELIQTFRDANDGRNDFYVLGSSGLMLRDQLYKPHVKDIDVHTCGQEFVRSDGIDFISDFLLPDGWQDRADVIDGVNVLSKRDIVCAIAGSNLAKPKGLEAKSALKILLTGEDIEITKQDLQALLVKNKEIASESRYALYSAAYDKFIELCDERAFGENPQRALYEAMKEME